MVKFVSLEDYHHFMIDKPECENGAEIKETILDDNLLQNVLYLTNCDMRIMLNVLEKYLIENIDKRRDNEFITGELVLGLDYEIILIICSTIRGMDEEEYIDKILKPKKSQFKAKTVRVNFTLPEPLKIDLDSFAQYLSISTSELVRNAVWDYIS